MSPAPLNVVHICDHLGWEGSRMHGVKRLFAWMIPRFDRRRFNVSLISLRRKDLSEDTLEQFGVDVTYLGRHKFDPRTYPALLDVLTKKGNEGLTRGNLSTYLGIDSSDARLTRALRTLKDDGAIRQVGTRRSARYFVSSGSRG